MFATSPAVFCFLFLPCFLEVVASVDVHLLDHGPMWDLQGGQTHVSLPRQNFLEQYKPDKSWGGAWKFKKRVHINLYCAGGGRDDTPVMLHRKRKESWQPLKSLQTLIRLLLCNNNKDNNSDNDVINKVINLNVICYLTILWSQN